MGTLYTVLPLDQKCVEWLDTEGVPHPPAAPSARYPTPREISETLHCLPGYRVSIHSDAHDREWSAQIDSDGDTWAQVRVRNFSSEDSPHEFYFSKGHPEVVFTVTERLARVCGALVVVGESGCRPVVVSPGAGTKDLLRDFP
jgi:hypothetical protein